MYARLIYEISSGYESLKRNKICLKTKNEMSRSLNLKTQSETKINNNNFFLYYGTNIFLVKLLILLQNLQITS